MKTKNIIITAVILLLSINGNAQKKKLMGNWKASNGSITSFSPQNMTMAGASYKYEVRGNKINVYNEYGDSMQYKYQVKGNKLYLYVEGVGTYILTKVKSNISRRNTNTAGANRLYGTFCTYSSSGYSGSSSYSTTQRITFDGRGHYTYGSESSYSGGGDGYYGGNNGYSGTYKVVGNKGVILTDAEGNQYRVAIYFVQNSGEITELKYDGTVYGKNICD